MKLPISIILAQLLMTACAVPANPADDATVSSPDVISPDVIDDSEHPRIAVDCTPRPGGATVHYHVRANVTAHVFFYGQPENGEPAQDWFAPVIWTNLADGNVAASASCAMPGYVLFTRYNDSATE